MLLKRVKRQSPIRSSGATSFVAVFNLLKGYLKGEVDHKEKPGLLKKLLPGSSKEKALEGDKKKNKIFVFFMTDGCDTCSDPKSIMMVNIAQLEFCFVF